METRNSKGGTVVVTAIAALAAEIADLGVGVALIAPDAAPPARAEAVDTSDRVRELEGRLERERARNEVLSRQLEAATGSAAAEAVEAVRDRGAEGFRALVALLPGGMLDPSTAQAEARTLLDGPRRETFSGEQLRAIRKHATR